MEVAEEGVELGDHHCAPGCRDARGEHAAKTAPQKGYFSEVPAPILGAALGSMTFGPTWKLFLLAAEVDAPPYVGALTAFFSCLSGLFICTYAMTILFSFRTFLEHAGQVAGLSSISAGSMAIINSGPLVAENVSQNFGEALWTMGLVLHLLSTVALLVFRLRHRGKEGFKDVFIPPLFVSTVGIGAAAATSTGVGSSRWLAVASFWTALVWCALLMPLVLYRLFKHGLPSPLMVPGWMILMAPIYLCLAGQLVVYPGEFGWLDHILLGAGVAVAIPCQYIIVKTLESRKFFPTCAAFTFPQNIGVVALSRFYLAHGYPFALILAGLSIAMATLLNLPVFGWFFVQIGTRKLFVRTPTKPLTQECI